MPACSPSESVMSLTRIVLKTSASKSLIRPASARIAESSVTVTVCPAWTRNLVSTGVDSS